MGKTSTQESSQTIDPQMYKEAIKQRNLVAGIAGMGYNPFEGNTVAAFQPGQLNAMNMSNQFANAFGFQGAAGQGIPEPTADANGIMGYSPEMMMRKEMGGDWKDMNKKIQQWHKQASAKSNPNKKQKTAGGGKK